MQQADEALRDGAPDAATEPSPEPGLLADVRGFARALKKLFGAQWDLFKAEWKLARSALAWMFIAGLVATVVGVGLALTALALLAFVLATWWGSWLWALLALCVLQLLVLAGALIMFRRCARWLTLPLTRSECKAPVRLSAHNDDTAQQPMVTPVSARERTT